MQTRETLGGGGGGGGEVCYKTKTSTYIDAFCGRRARRWQIATEHQKQDTSTWSEPSRIKMDLDIYTYTHIHVHVCM